MKTLYDVTIIAFGVIRVGLFTFSIIFTMNVYGLMKRLHDFEFKRNKRNMLMIIAAFWINLIVMFIVYISKFFPAFEATQSFRILWLI